MSLRSNDQEWNYALDSHSGSSFRLSAVNVVTAMKIVRRYADQDGDVWKKTTGQCLVQWTTIICSLLANVVPGKKFC